MKKLDSLRQFVIDAAPALKRDPDRLLTFVSHGDIKHKVRQAALSYRSHYTITLMVTDFTGNPDTLIIPIIAWLKQHQPDREDDDLFSFEVDPLDHERSDVTLSIKVSEFVAVTRDVDANGDPTGTVSAEHLSEVIYIGDHKDELPPLPEWETTGGSWKDHNW